MMRVLIFLIFVGLVALGVGWLADRPGDVAITWMGYRIETSVMVLVSAVAVLIAAALILWSLLRAIVRSPALVQRMRRDRRGVRGYQAISKGLIAVGAGDIRLARKYSAEARSIAADEPLALLLAAQTAQLAGDRVGADAAFRAMAGRPETKLIGLHGLFVEARRRGDAPTARACAEEAAASGPTPGWAGQAVLEMRCAAGDWLGALDMLERNHQSGLIGKDVYDRHRAVLLTARATAAEESDRDRAKPLALEAVKLAPTLVPAAALAGRLLSEAGEYRKANRILERAWRERPHPDLADAVAHLRSGDSARERLTRVQALARKAPSDTESALAVARAAIDAQEFATARTALAPHLQSPTRRVALLMADLEEMEHGDEGRAREWVGRAVHARPDPAWTADGIVSERWLPVSPVSGRIDAFEWKAPLAVLEAAPPEPVAAKEVAAIPARREEPVVEPVASTSKSTERQPKKMPESEPVTLSETDDGRSAPGPVPEPAQGEMPSAALLRTRSPGGSARQRAPHPHEALNPLVHAPDDPGPEPLSETAADRRLPRDLLE